MNGISFINFSQLNKVFQKTYANRFFLLEILLEKKHFLYLF